MEPDSTLATMSLIEEESQDVDTTVGRMTASRRKTVNEIKTGFSSSGLSNNVVSYRLASVKSSTSMSLPKADGHFQTIFLGSNRPFDIEPIIIREGGYRGRLAFLVDPVPTQAFRLFDLPPEIRTMIFSCVVKYWREAFQIHGRREKISRVSDGFPLYDTSILRVNKQCHEEAGGLVYSINKFIFPNTTTACQFLDIIGENNRRSMRYLGICDQWYRSSGKTLIKHITQMPHFRRLGIFSRIHIYPIASSMFIWFRELGQSTENFHRLIALVRFIHIGALALYDAARRDVFRLDFWRQKDFAERISGWYFGGRLEWLEGEDLDAQKAMKRMDGEGDEYDQH